MSGTGIRRIQIALLTALIGGCAQLPPRAAGPDVVAIAPAEGGALDQRISPAETRHPGQSGFRLVKEGTEAFVIRMQSARLATRSLDVQTYIWHADMTGIFLAGQLIESADRGVRVRLLLDDLDARARNDGLAALAAHPDIEVRMFNPWVTRKGTLAKAGEGALNFKRINRRMHNKSWIADNRIAVVGGRNVGDEYFGAGEEVNFVDLDFAMIGPVVRDASASFDRYWNSPSAYPMETLDPGGVNDAALARLRERLARATAGRDTSRYAEALRGDDVVQRMLAGDWPMEWSAKYEFVADDPAKVTMKKRDVKRTHVGVALVPMLQAAEEQVTIVSPYFVPGEEVTAGLAAAAATGKSVRILGCEPAHQGVRGGREIAVCRQLQPRPAFNVAQLRAGGPGGECRADARTRGAVRFPRDRPACLARDARGRQPALERRGERLQQRPGRLRLAAFPGLADEGVAPRRAALKRRGQTP